MLNIFLLLKIQIDEAIIKAEEEEINQLAKELELDLDELASVVQPIIESCTKDAISVSFAWSAHTSQNLDHTWRIVVHWLSNTVCLG